MAVKLRDGTYVCAICGSKHPNPPAAEACKESHQVLYIPMTKTELNRLIHALMQENFNLVPSSLWNTLQRYAKYQITNNGT